MTVLVVSDVLVELGERFLANGTGGLETTAMLLADPDGTVRRGVVPDQVATPWPRCRVEVTDTGKLELAAAVGDGRYVARIHSHPGHAFHSATDDANPALNHPGALSIVAPDFGATLASGLAECAIYVRRDQAWHDLPVGRARDQLILTIDGNDA